MIYLEHSVHRRIKNLLRSNQSHQAGQEVCGLLIGTKNPTSTHICRLIISPNQAVETHAEFLIAPKLQFRLMRLLRQSAYSIVGVFHTHPTNQVYPSDMDRHMGAGDGLVWAISDMTGRNLKFFSLEKAGQVVEYSFTYA